MKPNPHLNRATHPLAPGKYKAIYVLQTTSGSKTLIGDLVVTPNLWMLIEEWLDFPDGKEAPKKWWEVSASCRYQHAKWGQQDAILLNDPLDIRHLKRPTVTRAILPAPPEEPKS